MSPNGRREWLGNSPPFRHNVAELAQPRREWLGSLQPFHHNVAQLELGCHSTCCELP